MPGITNRDLLEMLKEIRGDLEEIVAAMQNCEWPSVEDAGIAFVCAEAALEIVNRLELDLIAEELAA